MRELLARVFRDVPPLLLRAGVLDADPAAFGAGPIFGSDGRHRFYLADLHDPLGWERVVEPLCPGFLVPCGRRMLDTDGHRHEVYLDDLHQAGGDVMCEVLTVPGEERSTIRLADRCPAGFEFARSFQNEGRLAVRSTGRLIWVTEARHTGRVEQVEALARGVLELPEAYERLRRDREDVYIDALDLAPDGSFFLTPGFLPHRG